MARSSKALKRAYLDVARAHRMKLGGEHRADDGPRYTDAEVQKLGEEGLALKKLSGRGYHYPIKDRTDLVNAIKAWGRAVASERAAVKRWIVKRTILLRMTFLLPPGWRPGTPDPSKGALA